MHAPLDTASLDALLHAARSALAIRPSTPLALATLVGVDGSSFRQPGARMLVDGEGRCLAGAISGGCLEADVAARAADVCSSGVGTVLTYDLRTDLQTIWGFDAACDGVAHILLEPLHDLEWLQHACAVRTGRRGGAVITLVGHTRAAAEIVEDTGNDKRSAHPETTSIAHPDTTSIAHPDTSIVHPGTMSIADGDALRYSRSAELEAASQQLASLIASTRHAMVLDVRTDSGVLTLFGDPIAPPIALHVIGAGRGAEAFARIATAMGWIVTIVDHRPALLESLELPANVQRRYARAEQAHELIADEATAVALLTHVFDVDRAWLDALLPLPHAYIGVLGSRQRAQRLLDSLPESVMSSRARRPVHAPIGLDIGGEDPESIALATIAEIHAVVHKRPGGHLRERRSPIHDRTPTPADRSAIAWRPATRDIIVAPSCPLPE